MKLKFNIGFNFQSALYMREIPSYLYVEIIHINRTARKQNNFPAKNITECEEYFKQIKKL